MNRQSFKGIARLITALLILGASAQVYAAPTIWAMDDGERIQQGDTSSALKQGTANSIWDPQSGRIDLFALRGETVAFQVVVEADDAGLADVTVDLTGLTGPGGIQIANASGATDPTNFVGRRIERFVEHFFSVNRASGGPWGSLGGIDAGAMTGMLPDALIPIEVAPAWAPYPMQIAANTNGVIWVDITIPETASAGIYSGEVVVGSAMGELSRLPVSIEVDEHQMPAFPVKTMLFYSKGNMRNRMGSASADAAERHLWKLYHRHHISPMHSALNTADVTTCSEALSGSLYSESGLYEGIAEGQGDGVLSIGTYGAFGAPDAADLAAVESIADELAAAGLLDSIDVFVYAMDESCGSSYGADWVNLIAGSSNPNVKKVRVGWTCSSQPAGQPVDIAMIASNHYAPSDVAPAEALGKQVWIYNGYQPYTGAFMTDHATVGTRVNGWIAAIHDIERWFYWESTFWYDTNNGGWGAFDPFVTAETFHNQHGEWAQGDGLLVYPGKQVDQFTDHSVGMDGVIASIRLKNWRRGIQDAGYYQLARAMEPEETEAIGRVLIPRSLSEARDTWETAWNQTGSNFFDARRQLFDILAAAPLPVEPNPQDTDVPPADTSPEDTDTDVPPADTSPEDTDVPPADTSPEDTDVPPADTSPDGDPTLTDESAIEIDPLQAAAPTTPGKKGCGCTVPGARSEQLRPSLMALLRLL